MDNTTLSVSVSSSRKLEECIEQARDLLLKRQKPDGHFVFELEADAIDLAGHVLEFFLEAFQPGLDRAEESVEE